MMLADYLARVWSPIKAVARFSPFHYYNPLDLVMGQPLPAGDLWILFAAGAAGLLLAAVVFSRRDL